MSRPASKLEETLSHLHQLYLSGERRKSNVHRIKKLIIDHPVAFDLKAEQIADALLKNNITMHDAYLILSASDREDLTTVNGTPASDDDLARYDLYVSLLKDKADIYEHKKTFAFEVFGYAWAHLQ